MAKTRKNGRGLVSRVAAPVGTAVNAAGKLVGTGFRAAKNLGRSVVKGANDVINSVGKSISSKRSGSKRNRRRGSTRRRKN